LNLRQLQDKRGDELVAGVLALVDEHRPLHLSLVGGDPLVRQREVTRLLPQLDARGRRLSRLKFSEQSMAKERNAQHKNQLGRI
jgi:organic radical activating enzyme